MKLQMTFVIIYNWKLMIYKSYQVEKNINILRNKIVLFYGENLGLKNDFKKKIKLFYNNSKINYFSQSEILSDQNIFFSNFFNISMFEEQNVYFIDQSTDKILDLLKEIETRMDNQKIFLFSEILDKKSKLRNHAEKSDSYDIIPCYADNEAAIKAIILEKLKEFDGVSPDLINIIFNNSNFNRIKLHNEIEKIKSCFSDKKIKKSTLINLLNEAENDDFNILKDAAIAGDNKKTNKLLSETLIEKEKIIFYINLINQRFNKINDIFTNYSYSIEKTVDSLKPPIFWKDKDCIIGQAKKWNSLKIKQILTETFDLEIKFKTEGKIDKNTLIRKLIVDVCNLANA